MGHDLKKALLFIFHDETPDEIQKSIDRYRQKYQLYLVYLDRQHKDLVAGHPVFTFQDMPDSRRIYEKLYRKAYEWSISWYNKESIVRHFSYRGINLSKGLRDILQFNLFPQFLCECRLIHHVIQMVQPEIILAENSGINPDRIISDKRDSGVSYLLVNRIAQQYKIPVASHYRLKKNIVSWLNRNWVRYQLRNKVVWLPEWLLRIAMLLKSLFQRVNPLNPQESSASAIVFSDFLLSYLPVDFFKTLKKRLRGHRFIFFFRVQKNKDILDRAGISFMDADSEAILDERRLRVQSKPKWKRVKRDIQNDPAFNSELSEGGIPIAPFLTPLLLFFGRHHFPDCLVRAERMRLLIQNNMVQNLIVLLDNGLFENPLVEVAAQHGIKSVSIQHGAIGWRLAYTPISSDYMAVWGKISKDLMVEDGENPQKLIITGTPRFDHYKDFHLPENEQKEFKSTLGINLNKKIALLATQATAFSTIIPFVDSPSLIKTIYEKAFAHMPDWQLVVKLHQLDKLEPEIFEWAKAHGIYVIQKADLPKLICISDVVMTQFSTVGVEALLLQKPLIILNLTNQEYVVPFVETGAANEVTSANQLPDKIKNVLSDEEMRVNRERFISGYVAYFGQSTNRFVDLFF